MVYLILLIVLSLNGHIQQNVYSSLWEGTDTSKIAGVYTPIDTAYRRECDGKVDCAFFSSPFIFYEDGTVAHVNGIAFASIQQLEDQLAIRYKKQFKRKQSIGVYRIQNDTITLSINYDFTGAGGTSKYMPAVLQGVVVNKDTIANFKMIEPYPLIFYDDFYRRMNGNFRYQVTEHILLYKGTIKQNLARN